MSMDKLIYDVGFGVLPKRVMIDTNLSIQAKAIFAYLCTYAGNGDNAFPGRKLITYQLGISKDTFTKYMKELKKYGYVEVYKSERKNGKFSHNIYKLIPCPKISYTVLPDTETPDTVNMDTNKNNNNKNNNNSKYVSKEENNLSLISKAYQENIGPIYPANREWIIEVSEKFEIDLFKRAIEICIDKSNVTPGYLKGILKKWDTEGILTLEQLRAKEMEFKNKKANNKNKTKNKANKPKSENHENEEIDPELLAEMKKQEELLGLN